MKLYTEIEELSPILSDQEKSGLVQIDDFIARTYLRWGDTRGSTVTLVDESDDILPIREATIYEISGHKYVDSSRMILIESLIWSQTLPTIVTPDIYITRIPLYAEKQIVRYIYEDTEGLKYIRYKLSSRGIDYISIKTYSGIEYLASFVANTLSLYYSSESMMHPISQSGEKDELLMANNVLLCVTRYANSMRNSK